MYPIISCCGLAVSVSIMYSTSAISKKYNLQIIKRSEVRQACVACAILGIGPLTFWGVIKAIEVGNGLEYILSVSNVWIAVFGQSCIVAWSFAILWYAKTTISTHNATQDTQSNQLIKPSIISKLKTYLDRHLPKNDRPHSRTARVCLSF